MSQTTKSSKPRLDYLDIAKCIAIFLVVWGHTTGNLDTPAYRVVLYSFHMPLFFLASGVVISRHRYEYDAAHWKDFLFKNAMTLLVPYLIWGAIYSNFSYANFIQMFYGSWQIIGKVSLLSSLWFLPCLFVARILAEAVLMLSWKFAKIERHLFAGLAAAVSFAIGFLLPEISIGYPLCFDVAFIGLGFILLGYATKELLLSLNDKPMYIDVALMVLFGGLLFAGQWVQGDDPTLVLMCNSTYGSIPAFFACSIGGIGLVLSASILLAKAFGGNSDSKLLKFLLWMGQNTIGIFLMHKPFLWEVVMPWIEGMGVTLPNAWWALLGSVVATAFSVVMVWIIDRYVPSLWGRFPRKPKPARKHITPAS